MPNLNKRSLQRAQGFTLIEILIAIAIFASLSLAAYQILQGVLRSDEISKAHDQNLKNLQRGMLLIERDFLQMVARKSRFHGVEEDKLKVLYVGKGVLDSESQGIEFNRLGWTNPFNLLPRSTLLRVGYRLQNEQLQRVYFLYPDVAAEENEYEQVILDGVEDLTFRFWNNGWVNSWSDDAALPSGIEITITSKRYGEIKRIFMLPSSDVN